MSTALGSPRCVAVRAAALAALLGSLLVACSPPQEPPPPPPEHPLSVGQGGALGNASATGASVSADGRWVAFTSLADNLVPGDTPGTNDVYLRDRTTGAVQRVREQVNGAPRISADGAHVSYLTVDGRLGVYARDTGERVEWVPSVSNSIRPVVPVGGGVAIYGAYSSFGIFSTACRVRDLATGAEQDCPPGGPGYGTAAFEGTSADGRFVVYSWIDQSGGGTSGRLLWDRDQDTTTVLTQPILSFGSSVSVSGDGQHLASVTFTSGSPLTAIVHDLVAGTSVAQPGPTPDGNTIPVEISAQGEHVLLASEATNLVADDTNGAVDLFIWDVVAGTISRISTTDEGAELPTGGGFCGSSGGQLLPDGSAACVLAAEPVVPADVNGVVDAYLLP